MDEKNEELKEEKTEDETSETSALEEENKAEETEPEEKSSEETTEEGIDYKAELERVKTEKENYKTAFLNEKDKNKNLRGSDQEDDYSEDDREVLTSERISEIARKAAENVRDGGIVDEIASSQSSTEAERELILFHYNNSLVKSGGSRENIARDMKRAKLLANESKYKVDAAELDRRNRSNDTKNKKGSAAGQKGDDTMKYDELSDADRALLKKFGLNASDVKRPS